MNQPSFPVNSPTVPSRHQPQPPSTDVLGADQPQLITLFLKEQQQHNDLNRFVTKPRQPNTIRVTSFNVHWWADCHHQPNRAAIIDAIALCQADILVLQESNAFLLSDKHPPEQVPTEVIEALQKLGFIYHDSDRIPKTEIADFITSIFSKYPIDTVIKHPLNGNRNAIEAHIRLPNDSLFALFGVHLDVFDDSEQTRTDQINCLAEIMHRTRLHMPNLALVGDMNALRRQDYSDARWEHFVNHDKLRGVQTCSKAMDTLQQHGFIDSFTWARADPPQCSTWSGRRIDYIFFHKDWQYEVVSSYVLHTCVSDHIPIIADFTFLTNPNKNPPKYTAKFPISKVLLYIGL